MASKTIGGRRKMGPVGSKLELELYVLLQGLQREDERLTQPGGVGCVTMEDGESLRDLVKTSGLGMKMAHVKKEEACVIIVVTVGGDITTWSPTINRTS